MAPAWAVAALTAAAWALRAAVWACLAASAMLVAEAAYMGLASLAAMLCRWRRRPDARYRWEPMPGAGGRDDVEAAADFPMVLVQIPMYNEREVYKLSIAAACALTCHQTVLSYKSWMIPLIRLLRMFLTWPLPGDFAVNYDVCLMTRIQKMSLDYHFKVEQESGSFVHSFFLALMHLDSPENKPDMKWEFTEANMKKFLSYFKSWSGGLVAAHMLPAVRI